MNSLLEEYRYNIIAAETKQYKVLSRDRWAYAFLLMAREVKRLQDALDAGAQRRDEVAPEYVTVPDGERTNGQRCVAIVPGWCASVAIMPDDFAS